METTLKKVNSNYHKLLNRGGDNEIFYPPPNFQNRYLSTYYKNKNKDMGAVKE